MAWGQEAPASLSRQGYHAAESGRCIQLDQLNLMSDAIEQVFSEVN